MKYIFSIISTFVVLFSNIGLQLNLHYCGGKLDNIAVEYVGKTIEKHSEDCCATTQFENSCCIDETLKQTTDETIVYQLSLQLPLFIVNKISDSKPNTFIEPYLVVQNNYFSYHIWSNAPPLYKLYHQYLLYA